MSLGKSFRIGARDKALQGVSDMEKSLFVADNETFLRLIQLARENHDLRNSLMTVLSMDREERKSSIRLIIDRMQRNNESKDVVSALRCLLTHSVAEKALEVLNQEE